MINSVVQTGRLTRDPDLRTTPSGISVATFTLAVSRTYVNGDGKRDADYINCVLWRKAAENFCNFTSKGSLVGIQGRLQSRSYDNKDGQRVYVTEVVVDQFSLLESKRDRENRQSQPHNTNNSNFNGVGNSNYGASTTPTPNPPNTSNVAPDFGDTNSIDITDDDLPF